MQIKPNRYWIIALILCVSLAGCANMPKLKRVKSVDERQGEVLQVSNIEVISVLDHTFDSVYLGASRLTNKQYKSDVSSWSVNEFLTGLTVEAIQQDQRFTYIDSAISEDEFRDVYANKKLSVINYDIARISKQLDRLNAVHNIDTLVLIIEDKIEDPIKDTIHDFTGYGLYRNAFSFNSVYLYSYLKVLLIDTRSKKVKKETTLTNYAKLPKEFWVENLEQFSPKEGRYIRNESLRMAGDNVLGALVNFNLIHEEAAYVTESGTKFVSNRLQEAGNYGDLYEDAVDRVYKALDMEKHFERYALLMKIRHEKVIQHFYPYEPIYLEWMRKHVSWEMLKPKIMEEYRKEFTADELNEIADFAETEAGAKMFVKIPIILNEQENIWLEEAKKKVDILDKDIMDFRERIVH